MNRINFRSPMFSIILVCCWFTAYPAAATFNEGVKAFQEKDYAKALKYFEPLAKKGQANAQFGLGLLYRNGLGVRKNLRKAYDLYKSSAVQGYAKAQYNLAILTLSLAKNNNDFNKSDAIAWLKLAAQQDIVRAQYFLGMFYWEGKHGLEADDVLAYMWVYIAASNFHPQSVSKLKIMKKQMTVDKINQATKLASRWTPEKRKKGDNPFKLLVQSGYCKTIDDQQSLQILDIKKSAQNLLTCLAKKDIHEDCKPDIIQLTVLYEYHRSTLRNNWWECQ
jgi:TPR repeat protein